MNLHDKHVKFYENINIPLLKRNGISCMLFVSFCKKPFTFILVFCKIRKAEGRCCGKAWDRYV